MRVAHLFIVAAVDHANSNDALVLEGVGGVTVEPGIPQTPGVHLHLTLSLLCHRHQTHILVSAEVQRFNLLTITPKFKII